MSESRDSSARSDGEESDLGRVHLKRRTVGCANSKWTVYLDHIADGRGNEVTDYVVIGGAIQRPDFITGVCVLPVIEGRIGLLHYYRHAIEEALWEVPRGFIDSGETPSAAALRELEEETGYKCASNDLIALGHYLPEPSTMQARGGVFAATRCRGEFIDAEGEIGLGRFALFEPQEVLAMAQRSEIQDASTLIAIYRYFAWLQE